MGINTSDKESSDCDSDDKANMGSKCKVSQNKDNLASKKKSKEAPKKTQPHKKAHVDSNDAENTDVNDENGGDQVDAYEKLWLEHEKDHLVLYE